MASNQPTTKGTQALQMGVFFSPPEQPRLDSFSSTQSLASPSHQTSTKIDFGMRLPSIGNILPPISPPVSPHTVTDKEPAPKDQVQDSIKDPLLFPDNKLSGRHDSTLPLFRTPERTTTHIIDQHIRERKKTVPQSHVPDRKDYDLAISFQHKIVGRYNANPQAYIKKELDFLKIYRPLAPKAVHVNGVKTKAADNPRPVKRQRVTKTSATVQKLPRAKRLPRASPREYALDSFDAAHIPYTSEPKVSRVTPHRDDTEYNSIVDFSPPTSTLGSSGKALKTEWRGHPLDLGKDPDRHMLHEAEIGLASTLRLSCAQYLCSKRRIFIGRLESLRNGREFRKTTAQQACKIDVNKASKLWSAFDKVGWFDPKYMTQYV